MTRGKTGDWRRSLRCVPLVERIFCRVEIAGECWVWTGPQTTSGYGKLNLDWKTRVTHRVVYEMLVGAVPIGLQLDHLCRNRLCVRPSHLEPVTGRENVIRGISGEILRRRHHAITHCPQGHAYDEKNTYRWKTSRVCITCRNARVKAFKAARRLTADRSAAPTNPPTQNPSSI